MKILVIGNPHGHQKYKTSVLKKADLVFITGDIGKADLIRKQAFINIERKKKGLLEIKYTLKQRKRAFMQVYNSSIKLMKNLSRFAPVYTIYGNAESSNSETRKMSKKIGLEIDLEFFYVDGECVGIGAVNWGDRKKFPLIHDSELGN